MKLMIMLCCYLMAAGSLLAQPQTKQQRSTYDLYWAGYLREVKKGTLKAEAEKGGKEKTEEYIACRGNNYLTETGFNALSKQLFAKVIVGMDGLPKEGTASSLAVDDETSKLGGNVNFATHKTSNVLFNIGVAGAASANQVTLFTENAYQKGFKLNGGFNVKLKSSIIYDPDSCGKVLVNRDLKFIGLIKKIKDFDTVNVERILFQIDSLRNILSPANPLNTVFPYKIDVEAVQKALSGRMDTLFFIATYVRNIPKPEKQEQDQKMLDSVLNKFPFKDSAQVDSILKAELGQFELKNAITTGYTMHWLSANYAFANNAYNIFDTSFTNNFSEATKKEFYRNHQVNLSYNYGRVTEKWMLYLFGGVSFGNRYALEDLKLEDDSLVGKVGIYLPELSVKALDVTKFAETYNKSYNFLMLQGGGFAFFGERKIIGVELYTAVRIKHKVPDLIDPKPSYTIRFGPLFSMTKDKGVVSNGTLGLMLQSSEFTPSRKNFGDRFSFAVRLSVPFSNLKYL